MSLLLKSERKMGAMLELSYLVTKVMVPPVPVMLVPRVSITSRLNARVPLILLAAGAGFGKTTLLSAWARETHCHVAWLTLDEEDNDLTRFWDYVLLALQTNTPVLGETAAALLHATPSPLFSTILTSLFNELAMLSQEVALVLDDYHLIDEPAIHQSLAFLLAHAPSCLHVVLATRVEPELPLSRLRARSQLVEIREADLRFQANEVTCFLTHTMKLTLREEDILLLFQRTEGWIAGLQLAALSLRMHTDPSAWVSQFRGSHHILQDYILQDILQREPLATQRFLLQTSVLTRLTAALCQRLCGEEASQELLEALVRANLFVTPLDDERQWYRLHPLFREALLARLQATESEHVPLLHRSASDWYAEQRQLPEAIVHALVAHDFSNASDLIERLVEPQSWHNDYHTLRRWLSDFPHDLLRANPTLAFLFAQALILTTPSGPLAWQAVEEPLNWAEHGYREAVNLTEVGAVLATRAVITSFQGDFPQAFTQAREALSLLPSQDQKFRGQCFCVLGMEAVLSGHTALAVPLLQQALALSAASGLLPATQFATFMLGEVCLATGDFEQAASFFRQVLSLSQETSDLTRNLLTDKMEDRRTHFERLAWHGLAYLAEAHNDLTEALHALRKSLVGGPFVLLHLLTPGLLLQVRILYGQGDIKQARTFLVEYGASALQASVQREILLCHAWLALAQGDVAVAAQWAESLLVEGPTPLVRREEEELLFARLRRAEGQPERALEALAPMLQEAKAQARRHQELQILIQQALAQAACDVQVDAQMTLQQAVTRARHEGAVRLFLEEGQPMETLLKTLLPDLQQEDPNAAFVRTLLEAFAKGSVLPETDPHTAALPCVPSLTPQERRVLQLLAKGVSNQGIAERLVISLATARKHVSNILGKLGAENRTQAVVLARAQSLL
jgi:LuxR family transcriptional regulator, maltose regulon positive regulatory protein